MGRVVRAVLRRRVVAVAAALLVSTVRAVVVPKIAGRADARVSPPLRPGTPPILGRGPVGMGSGG
jgi:hypothetical protein